MSQELKKLADSAYNEGFSSTHFMRHIYRSRACSVVLNEPNSECYNPANEPEMLALIQSLGYTHTPFGFIPNNRA